LTGWEFRRLELRRAVPTAPQDREIACVRNLERVAEGETTKVVLRVFQPRKVPGDPHGGYDCAFEIDGLAETLRKSTHGVDSLQALFLGLKAVHD
jgi:hypothetical protein